MALTQEQIEKFAADGYLILNNMVASALCDQMLAVTRQQLRHAVAPLEYEADVGYPGAPSSLAAPGGKTVRRLRDAYHRAACFRTWAHDPELTAMLAQLLNDRVRLSLAHHNCLMTKHPQFGTATGWHRDIRYWSFARPDLITVWLALGEETEVNGGLQFIPASHRMPIAPEQLDALDFLRPDIKQNRLLFEQGITLHLQKGDVVFFHSGLFHSAGPNSTENIKVSVAYAYYGGSNAPIAGTRSAAAGDMAIFP